MMSGAQRFAGFQQLHGIPPSDGEPDPLVTLARRGRRRQPTRPWVAITMIVSLDGATAIADRSGALGGPADRQVFHAVRRSVDVVMVGRRTAAAEGYGPSTIPGQRIGVITRGLDRQRDEQLLASELFTSGNAFLVMPPGAPPAPPGVDVLRAGDDRGVDLAVALTQLPTIGVDADSVGLEGGPVVNGVAVAAGVVDEVNLTLSNVLVAGTSARVAIGPAALPLHFDLAHLLLADGLLFGRWVRPPAEGVVSAG